MPYPQSSGIRWGIIGGSIAVALVLLLIVMSMFTVRPNVGFEAVLIKKPLIFGHGGVDTEPIRTGLAFVAPSTSAVYVNMQPLQADLDMKDIMSSDGTPLEFDAVIRLQVTNSVVLIRDFGEGWYDNNVKTQFFNLTRQAVRKHGMNETAISTTAIQAIDDEVGTGMEAYLERIHMPVRLVQVTVGKANPPDAIRTQRIETAAAQQRIITEGQTKLAEDARKAAETSRAEADNAYRLAMSLSPDQFLQLQAINMQRDVCKSGAKCTFIANGTRVTPILDSK